MAMNPRLGAGLDRRPVPVRTILVTIGLVLATVVLIRALQQLANVLGLLVVAAFVAVVLTPAVDFLDRKGLRRSMATLLVFLLGLGLISAMLVAFIQPIAREVNGFIDDFPHFVESAKQGEGPIGRLVQRFEIDEYIERNQDRFESSLRNAGAPALEVAKSLASGVFAFLTILVLSFLMVLEGPKVTAAALKLVARDHRDRVRLVAADCSKAVTGYMAGNLAISAVAGVSTFVFLSLAGVPFAGVLGLWVAFADLIPLVGATLGAIPTVGVAFLASPGKGIAALIFYVVYQQFENHVLQPTIMSRTVNLNPLTVLVSVLVGVELFGILGALLAIPGAGIIQVIARNLYDEQRGGLKDEPTIGTEEIPISKLGDGDGDGDAEPEPGPGPGPEAAPEQKQDLA